MPHSTETPEVARQIHATMEALARDYQLGDDLIQRIQENRATVVDLYDVARLCRTTVPQILTMARGARARSAGEPEPVPRR